MKSALYISTKTAGFDSGNPMAIQMRQAMAKLYGFVPSDDPFEFQRQLVSAKAKAIEAELKRAERNRKARERRAKLAALPKCPVCKRRNISIVEDKVHHCGDCGCQWVFGAVKPQPETKRPMAKLIDHSNELAHRPKPMAEPVAEKISRLKAVVRQAEEREARRQFGKYGKNRVRPEVPESDYAAIRKQHANPKAAYNNRLAEQQTLIAKLQAIGAYTAELMMNYDTYELRRALRRAERLRRPSIASRQAEKRVFRIDGLAITEDLREKMVFVIRRLRGQLPLHWEQASLRDLTFHLIAVCGKAGRKWFAELGLPEPKPAASIQAAAPVQAPAPAPVAAALTVDSAVERLWTAIFGSLGAGY